MPNLNEIAPYSSKHELPHSYALVSFTPDYRMFALLWFITWPLFFAWLTAKVCFKEATHADEEVVREEPVRESEPVRVAEATAKAIAAVEDTMARMVMVAAEREATAKAAVIAAKARAAEVAEREGEAKAAADAAEAVLLARSFGSVLTTTVVEREDREREAVAAAGRAWRQWGEDHAASAKAAEEAADAERELEAARNARVAAEGRAQAELELARG